VPWHIHLAEEQYQVEQSLTRFGKRPLHAVADLDVDLANMIVVHACWFDAGERALLAERGGSPRLLPGLQHVPRRRGHRPLDLHARGVTIGLGTDGGCSNNRVSVLDEMRMARCLQKVHRTDGQAITAETAFALGTVGGGACCACRSGEHRPRVPLRSGRARPRRPLAVASAGAGKERGLCAVPRAITDVVVDGRLKSSSPVA
jgi:5-methylthioadenosine/S-adenosylhomocysteine deaminase